MKQHFARWGIPETVISDNGPQYSSEQFKYFSRLCDFKHKTSSPGHAQSNGKVETAVKSAKGIMRKTKKSNSDPFIALFNFRNTPQQVTDYSPVQQLINRRTRTLLPMKSSLLESNIPENVQENIQRSKEKQAKKLQPKCKIPARTQSRRYCADRPTTRKQRVGERSCKKETQ